MGFETRVLETIEPKLGNYGLASFSYGTLFVDRITEDQAGDVLQELRQGNRFGTVEITRIGQTSEYAYDFV
jgi:hypothetical protein